MDLSKMKRILQMKTNCKTFAQGLKSVIHDPRVKNLYANSVLKL